MKRGIPEPSAAGVTLGEPPTLVAPLREQVEQALTAWLEPPADAALSFRELEPGDPLGSLAVELCRGDRQLTLILREAQPGALWQSDGLQVTCRRKPGSDPAQDELLSRWLRHLDQRFRHPAAGAGRADALRAALRGWQPFGRPGVDDREYVRMDVGHDGICAILSVSFRCNQRCRMCWQRRNWPEPPRELLPRWIDQLAATGAQVLSLTGGEPTMHPDLHQLIRRAAGHGLRVHLQTNGVRLADQQYLDELRQAGLDAVFIAFHSADPVVSDALTAAPGTHARTLRGIVNALTAGMEVFLVACIEKSTVTGLAEHARYVVEHFHDPFPANPVKLVDYAQPGNYEPAVMCATLVTLGEVRPHLAAAGRILQKAKIPFGANGPCGFPMCIFSDEPTLPRWRLHRIEEGDVDWRVFVPACDGCAARSYCHGLRHEYVRIHGSGGVVPFRHIPEPGS